MVECSERNDNSYECDGFISANGVPAKVLGRAHGNLCLLVPLNDGDCSRISKAYVPEAEITVDNRGLHYDEGVVTYDSVELNNFSDKTRRLASDVEALERELALVGIEVGGLE